MRRHHSLGKIEFKTLFYRFQFSVENFSSILPIFSSTLFKTNHILFKVMFKASCSNCSIRIIYGFLILLFFLDYYYLFLLLHVFRNILLYARHCRVSRQYLPLAKILLLSDRVTTQSGLMLGCRFSKIQSISGSFPFFKIGLLQLSIGVLHIFSQTSKFSLWQILNLVPIFC